VAMLADEGVAAALGIVDGTYLGLFSRVEKRASRSERREASVEKCGITPRHATIAEPGRGGTYPYCDQGAVVRPTSKWSGHAATRERVAELFRTALRAA
jgi:hypothetical protein